MELAFRNSWACFDSEEFACRIRSEIMGNNALRLTSKERARSNGQGNLRKIKLVRYINFIENQLAMIDKCFKDFEQLWIEKANLCYFKRF